MRNLILAAMFFLSGTTAFASPEMFAGNWLGKGTYILKEELTQCSEFRLSFSATRDVFVFEGGNRICEKHSEQFYRVPMEFANGVIKFNGQEVGTYTENKMDVHFSMPENGNHRNWRMSMRREGNHLVYEESRTLDGETTPLISFSGLLMLEQ